MILIVTFVLLLIDMMQNKQGVIVTITSTAVSRNYEYLSVYSATKAAAHSITMTAAKELSPLGKISIMDRNFYSPLD
jgi:short-subunit dehydrogenase